MRNIDRMREKAIAEVDRRAEIARAGLFTRGTGQAYEYDQTLREAIIARDAPAGPIDPDDVPHIAAERAALAAVGIVKTLRDVAAEVITAANAQCRASAVIKQKRRTAKLRIAKATTMLDIASIVDGMGIASRKGS